MPVVQLAQGMQKAVYTVKGPGTQRIYVRMALVSYRKEITTSGGKGEEENM